MAIDEPPAPMRKTSAPVSAQYPSGTKASIANPEEIGSLAWHTNRPSRLDRQLVSPISSASGSISSNMSEHASNRSILCVVTRAPALNGSRARNSTTSR